MANVELHWSHSSDKWYLRRRLMKMIADECLRQVKQLPGGCPKIKIDGVNRSMGVKITLEDINAPDNS